ncbi:glycosyltransferase family A protein [Flavobacterium davisii]|uniref:glycosyltransferase family A protein n=1 Tax=Flavobacterium davisii TaxID=2906077 RepID=UPI0035CF2ED5
MEIEKKDIEILVSTMNRNSLNFLYQMFADFSNIGFNILIINQTTTKNILHSNHPNIRVINTYTIGLSISRNIALQNAYGTILVIADDDIVFEKDFEKILLKNYNNFPNTHVICFQAKKDDKTLLKKYPSQKKENIKAIDILNVANIEITINRQNINPSYLKYNDWFGLNAMFGLGEEPVFLSNLKKKGYRIDFIPETIVTHPNLTTTDKIHFSEKYFAYGAVYAHIFKNRYIFWLLLKLFFDLKQGILKFYHIKKAFFMGLKGKTKYLELSKLNSL